MSSEIRNILNVKGTTNVVRLSDSIMKMIQDGKSVTLAGMGNDAVNQKTKALIRVRQFMGSRGFDVTWYSSFESSSGVRDGKTVYVIHTNVIVTPNNKE